MSGDQKGTWTSGVTEEPPEVLWVVHELHCILNYCLKIRKSSHLTAERGQKLQCRLSVPFLVALNWNNDNASEQLYRSGLKPRCVSHCQSPRVRVQYLYGRA